MRLVRAFLRDPDVRGLLGRKVGQLDAESFAEAVGDFIELSVDLSARLLGLAQGGPAATSAPPPLGQLA